MGNRERGGPKEYDDMVARVSQLCRQERLRTSKENTSEEVAKRNILLRRRGQIY